jgi:AraC-like DNA-binding protein
VIVLVTPEIYCGDLDIMKQVAIPQLSIEQVIHGISRSDRHHDFYISEISDCILSDHPFRHDFYLVALCTSGFMRLTINLQEYLLEPSTLIVLSPYQIIEILEYSSDLKVTNLFFKKEFLISDLINSPFIEKRYIYKSGTCLRISLTENNSETIHTLFSLIGNKASSDHPYRMESIKSFIDALLYEIESVDQTSMAGAKERPSRKQAIMKGFLDLLAGNLYQQRSLKFYSDSLFISTQYLMETVKEVSGKTAGDLIDEALILEAQALLKLPKYNVAMVSELLNFADQSFFGKFFKRKSGLSPTQYKTAITHYHYHTSESRQMIN